VDLDPDAPGEIGSAASQEEVLAGLPDVVVAQVTAPEERPDRRQVPGRRPPDVHVPLYLDLRSSPPPEAG
jgi:hypothetical protein